MAIISGTTVTLIEATITGYDTFGAPIVGENPVEVDNVLIGQPETDEITTSVSLYGKQIIYMLGIPKGDTHNWVDKKVEWTDAYGIKHTFKTFGFPITGIEANLPKQMPWHMKVRCEAYE